MALTTVQKVRIEVADTDVNFPILSDDEYKYFLEKNDDSIRRASLDAAKTILLKLSINGSDQTVDIFSIKGAKAAEQYRQALTLYIKNPDLNQLLQNVQGWAGGISKAEMLANDTNSDNVIVPNPNTPPYSTSTDYFTV